MKSRDQIRQMLVDMGIWPMFNFLRNIPAVLLWMANGCSGAAPHPIKMMAVKAYLRRYALHDFYETGTYYGDTLACIARTGAHCVSIELSDGLYAKAQKNFAGWKNVSLLKGDSGHVLPEQLKAVDRPTLFWLDGHYSEGVTASSDVNTPISAELNAILAHPIKEHVILIDDARCFDGKNGYPNLDELLSTIRKHGVYHVEVSIDIIRLTPA